MSGADVDEVAAAGLDAEALQRFRGQVRSDVLLALFDYWLALNRASGLPAPADVDPLAIPRQVLPHCMLIDVEWGGASRPESFRLRFRLMGTAVVANRVGLAPPDPTGRYLDEVEFREGAARPLSFYGMTASLGRPRYHRLAYSSDHPRSAGIYHRLALPLAAVGGRVSRLLAGFSRGG